MACEKVVGWAGTVGRGARICMFVGWVVQAWSPRSRRLQLQVEKWHALDVGCRRGGPVAVCVFVAAF